MGNTGGVRISLKKEQIIAVAAAGRSGCTRKEAAQLSGVPDGTIGYIVRRLRKQGIEVDFARPNGDAWSAAIAELKDA